MPRSTVGMEGDTLVYRGEGAEGSSLLLSSYGNDVIDARDGEADNIDCGIGQDKAIVDAVDIVSNCETVEGARSNGGPGVPGGPGGPRGKATITIPRAKPAAVAAKGLKVKVSCA